MGSLLDDEGVSVAASLGIADSLEIPKKARIRIRLKLIEKPAPSDKVIS
jgi:hypothetical protein